MYGINFFNVSTDDCLHYVDAIIGTKQYLLGKYEDTLGLQCHYIAGSLFILFFLFYST